MMRILLLLKGVIMKKYTKQEIDNMSDDELFKMLDKRSAELMSRPLDKYHTKLYAATSGIINGNGFDRDVVDTASKIGLENENEINSKINKIKSKWDGKL